MPVEEQFAAGPGRPQPLRGGPVRSVPGGRDPALRRRQTSRKVGGHAGHPRRCPADAHTAAISTIEEARANLTAMENGDATALLTPDELELASLRRPRVVDDMAALITTERHDRLVAFLRGGDRTAMFAYLLAARTRVRDISKTAGEPSSMTDTDALAHRAAGGAASRTVAGPLGPCQGAGLRRA